MKAVPNLTLAYEFVRSLFWGFLCPRKNLLLEGRWPLYAVVLAGLGMVVAMSTMTSFRIAQRRHAMEWSLTSILDPPSPRRTLPRLVAEECLFANGPYAVWIALLWWAHCAFLPRKHWKRGMSYLHAAAGFPLPYVLVWLFPLRWWFIEGKIWFFLLTRFKYDIGSVPVWYMLSDVIRWGSVCAGIVLVVVGVRNNLRVFDQAPGAAAPGCDRSARPDGGEC